ncbi:HIT-like domain-containing protein [Limtongia smithiae]|uniref:HIT-like domain-containing protein n=1 Tax=Limtongia smithiae TaxID=1125753 RepID=UPI0034CD5760
MSSSASCLFCRIIKGEIPSFKVYETSKVYAFLDIGPTAEGHTLVIPKYHGRFLQDIPDDYLAEIAPAAKKIAIALGAVKDAPFDAKFQYNILQNNGPSAHQVIEHVHFHVMPKPSEDEGLIVGWPGKATDMDKLKDLHAKLVDSIAKLE